MTSDGNARAKPVAWRVHSAQTGSIYAKDVQWFYPTSCESDAKEAARFLRAECEPLYAHPPASGVEAGGVRVNPAALVPFVSASKSYDEFVNPHVFVEDGEISFLRLDADGNRWKQKIGASEFKALQDFTAKVAAPAPSPHDAGVRAEPVAWRKALAATEQWLDALLSKMDDALEHDRHVHFHMNASSSAFSGYYSIEYNKVYQARQKLRAIRALSSQNGEGEYGQ